MNLPNIEVVRGTNPAVLRNDSDPTDPSGLNQLGYGEREFRHLASCIRGVFEELLVQLPRSIAEQMPSCIPLYGSALPPHQKHTLASARFAIDLPPDRSPPFQGLIIRFTPEQVLSDNTLLHKIIGHEAIHVAICPGTAITNTIAESFAAALEKECFPDSSDLRMNADWNGDAFVGSTGLRVDDYAWLAKDDIYDSSLYLSAAHALQHFTARQIWNICASLQAQARETGKIPTFQHVKASLLQEEPDVGKAALETLPFRHLEPGSHQCVFPKGRDGACVYTFAVAENPQFNPQIRDVTHAVQYSCRGQNGEHRLEFLGKSIPTPITTHWSPLPPSYSFNFTSLANLIGDYGYCAPSAVEEIRCSTGKWKFALRPPADNTSTET